MRRLVAALCSIASPLLVVSGSASASCGSGVALHETGYLGALLKSDVRDAGAIAGGVRPGCNDTPQTVDGKRVDPVAPSTPVSLRRIEGVPARMAVAVQGEHRMAYLAPGYLLTPAHPLFALVRQDVHKALACGRTSTVHARSASQPFYTPRLVLTRPGRDLQVVFRDATRFRGATRDGVPYVAEYASIRASGRRCTVNGVHVLVATTVTIGARHLTPN